MDMDMDIPRCANDLIISKTCQDFSRSDVTTCIAIDSVHSCIATKLLPKSTIYLLHSNSI